MSYKFTATARDAFFRLLDIARNFASAGDAVPFALAWMVLGKLISAGRLVGVNRITELDARDAWQRVGASGLPRQLSEIIQEAIRKGLGDRDGDSQREASYIVAQLLDSGPASAWEMQDVGWWLTTRGRSQMDAFPAYEPTLCDLIVSALMIQPGELVWVPFDTSGQFVVRLARAGARVCRAGPGYSSAELTALLLALEDDATCFDAVDFSGNLPDPAGGDRITHCIVTAPMAMKVPRTPEWRRWQQGPVEVRRLWATADEMDRSDAWGVAAMWPSVEKRGVFLTSPSLLFAQGQEQRLRKSLLLGQTGNMVAAAVSLPTNSLSATGVAPTLLILDALPQPAGVRMIDVSGSSSGDGIKHRFGKDIRGDAVLAMLAPNGITPQVAADVSVGEIEEHDFSLMPARYLRRVEDLEGERRPLGDLLLTTVRSPVPSKDLNVIPVWEVGITMLDRWRPIEGGYERSMTLTPRKADEAMLREGDIVLSIKGTVGKVGIVGGIPSSVADAVAYRMDGPSAAAEGHPLTSAAVAAASCVALRVDRQQVLPEYLLLYMRSDDFKRQLEALRVGSSIAHITPSALMTGVLVPIRPLAQQAALSDRYRELRDMEEQVDQLVLRMNRVRDELFSVPGQQD